jgi:hypothetical protein
MENKVPHTRPSFAENIFINYIHIYMSYPLDVE